MFVFTKRLNRPQSIILRFLVLIPLIVFWGCDNGKTDPIDQTPEETTRCEDNAKIIVDSFILENNVWGRGDLTDYSQCITLIQTGGDLTFKWNWQWPAGQFNVKAYPEIIYGWKPWMSGSTTSNLPVRMSEGKIITVSFDISKAELSGSGNLAFDLWVTNSAEVNSGAITREIMIWVSTAQMQPGGVKLDTVTIDGINFDFYKGDWDWTYLAFQQKSGEPVEIIHLNNFLTYLLDHQYLGADEFLATIEFGNEVISGTGETIIKNYQITIQ